jgi:hypothetical protein
MKLIITEQQLRRIIEGLGTSLAYNPKEVAEFDIDDYDDDDYDSMENDPENFSYKMKHKEKMGKMKTSHIDGHSNFTPSYSAFNEPENKGKHIDHNKQWSPIKPDDLPLDKYLAQKKRKEEEKTLKNKLK